MVPFQTMDAVASKRAYPPRRRQSPVKPARAKWEVAAVTLAEINRMIRAAIRAAKQEGAPVIEVTIGDEATVRIPLAPDKPIAEADEVVL